MLKLIKGQAKPKPNKSALKIAKELALLAKTGRVKSVVIIYALEEEIHHDISDVDETDCVDLLYGIEQARMTLLGY